MEVQHDKKRHSFTVDGREKGSVEGVNEVLSYGENELCLDTSEGLLTIGGKDLRIVRFNVEGGSLAFTGAVNAIKYDAKKPPLLKRIFK